MAPKKKKKVRYTQRQIEKMSLSEYVEAFLVEGSWLRKFNDPIRQLMLQRFKLYQSEVAERDVLAQHIADQARYLAIAEAVKGDLNDPDNPIHTFYEEDRVKQLEEAKSYLVELKENLEAANEEGKAKAQSSITNMTLEIMRLELDEPYLKYEYFEEKLNDYASEHYYEEMVEMSQMEIKYCQDQRLALCVKLFGEVPEGQHKETALLDQQ